MAVNFLNSSVLSRGPGALSGWYCTPKARFSEVLHASTVPSSRFRCVTARPGSGYARRVDGVGVVCEVMAILPVARSFTGWLPPRWPNLSLKVFAP